PFSASTRVAAASSSWRVRSRRRSKRLVPANATVDALFITEQVFSYPNACPDVKSPRARGAWAALPIPPPLMRRGKRDDGACGGRLEARLRNRDRARAGLELEHGHEVVLGPGGIHPCHPAPDAGHLPSREPAHQVEAVDARVQDDAAAARARVVEPAELRRLEALVDEEGAQRAEGGQAVPDGARHRVPAQCL